MAAGSKVSAYAELARVFAGAVKSKAYGRVLLSIWGAFLFTALVGIPLFKARGGGRRGGRESVASPTGSLKSPAGSGRRAGSGSPVAAIVRILRKYIFTAHGGFLGVYILTLCTRILITVQLADQGGRLGSYMGARQWTKMFLGQASLGLWFLSAAFATATMKFLEKRVTLSVRQIIYNELLDRYLGQDLKYYHANVPDVASRFTTEIAEFSHASVKTLGHLLKPSIDIMYLSYTIGRRLGVVPLMTFLSFFALAQRMLQQVFSVLPKSIKQLTVEKQALEASLRSSHEQVHMYREQVALQGGTACEHRTLARLHRDVSHHMMLTAYTHTVVDVLQTYVLKYGGAMCGFSVVIPSVWMGDPKRDPAEVTAAYLSNTTLLATLATEIKDFVEAWQDVTKVSGLASRIVDLLAEMDAARANGVIAHKRAAGNELTLTDLTVCTPGTEERPPTVLVRGLTHTVREGQHLVIRGQNGIGKTSLLRTICGLWPAAGGDIALPKSGYFAVSQDAYLPRHASLREQLAYPKGADALGTDRAIELLDAVQLKPFAAQLDDADVEWRTQLSGGEKQRLSWARLLFHAPAFAFVDEGTSQVDPAGCDRLHALAKEAGITLVSISHHSTVDAHHLHALDLRPTALGDAAAAPAVVPVRVGSPSE